MKLEILIATLGAHLGGIEKRIPTPKSNVSYLISIQGDPIQEIPVGLKRADIRLVFTSTRGLSSNRNHAFEHAQGDLLMLMDDDVDLIHGFDQHVFRVFSNDRIDVACFQIQTPYGQPDYKSYPHNAQRLTSLEAFKRVSSIEMVLRKSSLDRTPVRFDARFGLGATFPSGEELLFLYACYKKGFYIHFQPEFTVVHPYTSTGKRGSPYDPDRLKLTGAQSVVLFGRWGGLLRNVLAGMRRYSDYRHEMSFWQFLKWKQEGARVILRDLPSGTNTIDGTHQR